MMRIFIVIFSILCIISTTNVVFASLPKPEKTKAVQAVNRTWCYCNPTTCKKTNKREVIITYDASGAAVSHISPAAKGLVPMFPAPHLSHQTAYRISSRSLGKMTLVGYTPDYSQLQAVIVLTYQGRNKFVIVNANSVTKDCKWR